MAKYISNRQQNLKIGIVSYTEDKTVLEVIGNVGIGTTNPTSKLTVVGDARITGILTIGTSSIVLDGANNKIYVGSGVTISATEISIGSNIIGSGTNINGALPNQGGVPIQENEIDMRNGCLVVFTSTDQAGNFRIGDGVVINQQSGTISGTFYSKSLFSTMTPFILALGGD